MTARRKGSRALTKTQLRKRYSSYRKEGKLLQNKGLISSRANLSKDRPSLAVRKKIDSLKGIFNGTQQSVEITDVMVPKYKKMGYRVIGRRVVLDKRPGQRFVRRRSELILNEEKSSGGTSGNAFESVLIPFNITSLEAFIAWIREDPDQLMALLPPGTAFAFTYHGNNSRMIFTDPLELADYLETYAAGPEAWQHFILYRLRHPNQWRGGSGRRNFKPSSQDRREGTKSRSGEYKRYYQHHQEQKIRYQREYRRKQKERFK